jgi:hypothetical protein
MLRAVEEAVPRVNRRSATLLGCCAARFPSGPIEGGRDDAYHDDRKRNSAPQFHAIRALLFSE